MQPRPKFVERSSHENLSEWLCSLFDATFSFENVLALRPIYHGATNVAYNLRDSTYKRMGSGFGLTTSKDAKTDSMSLIFEHLAESVTQAIRQHVFITESDRIHGGHSKTESMLAHYQRVRTCSKPWTTSPTLLQRVQFLSTNRHSDCFDQDPMFTAGYSSLGFINNVTNTSRTLLLSPRCIHVLC